MTVSDDLVVLGARSKEGWRLRSSPVHCYQLDQGTSGPCAGCPILCHRQVLPSAGRRIHAESLPSGRMALVSVHRLHAHRRVPARFMCERWEFSADVARALLKAGDLHQESFRREEVVNQLAALQLGCELLVNGLDDRQKSGEIATTMLDYCHRLARTLLG